MGKNYPRQVMSAREMELALSRIAAEIIETHQDLGDVVLIGIRRRGVPLGKKLQKKVKKLAGRQLPFGVLDITFYRDDLSMVHNQPVVEGSHLDFEIASKEVLLVDDVVYTGRTVRAALDSLLDYGRPRKVELVALIDRGNRELPIRADYVGKHMEIADNEVVEVRVPSIDDDEGVYITIKELIRESN